MSLETIIPGYFTWRVGYENIFEEQNIIAAECLVYFNMEEPYVFGLPQVCLAYTCARQDNNGLEWLITIANLTRIT